MREERQGLILGPYERHSPAVFVDGVPDTFGQDLFPGDLERLEPYIEAAINRVPLFGEAGIKNVINGPIAYTPAGSPMIGPPWGLKNYWQSAGNSYAVPPPAGPGGRPAHWHHTGET